MASTKTITLEQLKEHNTKKDFYILLHGKVYDATKFLDEHPGGDEVILAEGGQDATDAFEDVGHSDEARVLLPDMLVGEFVSTGAPVKTAAQEAQAKTNAAVASAVESGSNLFYFIPLALLGAYFGYRFYN